MRTLRRTALSAALITVSVIAGTQPAYAGTARGPGGQTLTATPSTGVSRAGATVTVSGSGYDTTKGIYVGYCVDNGAGKTPTPCGGGADTSGSLGASHWISSNPPSYAEDLTTPYGSGGSFRVTVKITPTIGDVDCTVRRCVVATRADHTRPADRSQDVRVPVTFAAAPAPSRSNAAPPTTGSGTATGAPRTGTPGATPSTATLPSAAASAGTTGGVPADAGGTTPAAGTAPTEAQVTRVSAASSLDAGRWWPVVLGASLLLVTLLIGLRRRRRKLAR
ncbi:hypothetical protein ACWD6L_19140 [Micromonospora profundi]|uniref:hypothetical protein n=1 Tax=Micromonospora sp. NRRL B-16802 TaxID=1415541 RepID=UPI0006AE21FF|nr:hypothetical protein [Micromonospora sp. NRRL B-16802]KOX11770.1 hypothetical protein ADK66_06245 [Micromonospora sp. NRRL B-16802]